MSRIPLPSSASAQKRIAPLSPILEQKKFNPILRRRSKSVADLHLVRENRALFKNAISASQGLVNNIKSKPPPIRKQLAPVNANIGAIATKAPRRRSKSVVELASKLKTTVKRPPPVKASVKPTAPQKRPASAEGAVKPKVSRKVPEWDYKTRFGILFDQFQNLKAKYDELVESLPQQEENKKELVSLRTRNGYLEEENVQIKSRLALLEDIEVRHQTLKKSHEKLQDEMEITEQQLKTTAKQNATLLETSAKLEKEVERFNEEANELRKEVVRHEQLRRELHNTIQDLKGNIRVFCRVRPALEEEEQTKLPCNIDFVDEQTLEIKRSKQSVGVGGKMNDIKNEFQFDKVFSPQIGQREVFEELAQLVQSALDGYNVCVFAYGQTGSGKTYTMQGEMLPEKLGMIPRTIDLIFHSMKKLEASSWLYKIRASFLEIYNENIVDLLDPSNRQPKEIRYNDGKGTTVSNLIVKNIETAYEMKRLMGIAQNNRAQAATDYNAHSSRSHAVTRIYIEGRNQETNTVLVGSINLVDLAGSESAKTSTAARLAETKNINKSLSNLGNVMLALHKKDQHVPYRNCKLTYLLQSCLGGNSKTLMFVNISPLEECFNESLNSLRFAQTVKEVKTNIKRNKTCV